MKKEFIILCCFIFSFVSCFDDKGNYDYQDADDIVITNISNIVEVLGSSDTIKVNPIVTSSKEGVIKGDNPNFQFSYKLENKLSGDHWLDINLEKSLNLNMFATLVANTYVCCFTVTDVRTGIETSYPFKIKVTSPTYEGWMVLCNEGDKNRVRMDMVARVSSERNVIAYDVLTPLGLPELTDATRIGFAPSQYENPGDIIYVMSKTGTYRLDRETFKTDESWNIFTIDFILPRENEHIINYMPLNHGSTYEPLGCFCVSDAGNAYCQLGYESTGAVFESPINTSSRGGTPEFRVAPYIGVSMARPGDGESALFYDVDHQRFVGWKHVEYSDSQQTLTPLTDPETNKLFSFQTGMDLVYMESTRISNGLVYSILQDNSGKRYIYGINMSGNGFVQESKYETSGIRDFDKATVFAFHSKFPYMFYAVGNKVYMHNLGTGVTYPMDVIQLGDKEVVTMLKFNLYVQNSLDDLSDQSYEFMSRQFDLMVGSYNTVATDGNGGKLGFYPVNGVNNSVSKGAEYTGFARIKDVVYRERR